MNGYVCFYKGKRKEVHAASTLEAQEKAAVLFKAKKSWEITTMLAEKGNKKVVHIADF